MINYKLNYWEEAISSSLEEHGLLTNEVKKHLSSIAKDLVNSADLQSQAFGEDIAHKYEKPKHSNPEQTITELKKYIAQLEGENLAYKKGVARRRNTTPDKVYIEHGNVKYEY